MKLSYEIKLNVPGLGDKDGEYVTEEIRLAIEESIPESVDSDEGREYAIEVLRVNN